MIIKLFSKKSIIEYNFRKEDINPDKYKTALTASKTYLEVPYELEHWEVRGLMLLTIKHYFLQC